MFSALTEQGVVARAIAQQVLQLQLRNPRDFTVDPRRTVDDRPYGGGPGMVMMPEPLVKCIEHTQVCVRARAGEAQAKVIYLSPQGKRFDHRAAKALAKRDSLILLAGRYEGIDQRVIDHYVDEEWSIGDYVLSGGELPAMVMIDAIARLLPGALGNEDSVSQDSFAEGLLDCPHYTRPEHFGGETVPSVLLSGDHQAIATWRMQQALGQTWLRRPDLLNKVELSSEQQALLEEFKKAH